MNIYRLSYLLATVLPLVFTLPKQERDADLGMVTSTIVTALSPVTPTIVQQELVAASVTDLTVRAVFPTGVQSLRLLVSWRPPANDTLEADQRLPTGYKLFLRLLNTSDTYCSKGSKEQEYINIDDPNKSSVMLPSAVFKLHGANMKIRYTCTYLAELVSTPNNKNISVVYTVPQCIQDVCLCLPDTLPVPLNVTVEQLPVNVNVSWTLDRQLTGGKIVLKLGEELFLSNALRSVYQKTWQKEVSHRSIGNSVRFNTIIPQQYVKPGLNYKVDVYAMRDDGCRGHAGNITFLAQNDIQDEEDRDKGQLLLTVILPIVSITLASCLALVMMWQRCRIWIHRKLGGNQLRPIHSWQGVYKAVSGNSHVTRITFPVLQERNIIYVEKEIEEAKARGDADMYEMSYSRLDLGRQIGKGAFGRVYLAKAEAIAGIPGFITVAVKKLKHRATHDEVEEFLSEISMMKKVGKHPNIVTMLGCCTLKEPFCMLMEYVPCGDLLQYLRRLRLEYERVIGRSLQFSSTMHRPMPHYVDVVNLDSDGSYVQPESLQSISSGRPSITETEWSLLSSEGALVTPTEFTRPKLECVLDPKELQDFAVQIARGMAHLEQRRITHRDLAARNVLIDERKTLKISDFGLSRTGIYVNTKRKKVPLRWLSVEAMRDNLYSSKSDVWAFAIVLWEIGTLGGFPYPTVADLNLLQFLLDGKRLEKPDNCSDELYSLMLKCWSHSADMRPTFAELVTHLDSVICRKRVYVDFNKLKPNYTFPPTEQAVDHKEEDGNS